jgi:hypothetical protein
MATWQFDLHCFPRDLLQRYSSNVSVPIYFDIDDVTEFALETTKTGLIYEAFDELLPRAKSWSKEIDIWGTDEGNRIDVHRQGASITSIFVRIDARHINHTFLMKFLEKCKNFNWLLVTQDKLVLSPSMIKLLEAIKKSHAFAFVSDPEEFLKNLKKSLQESPED